MGEFDPSLMIEACYAAAFAPELWTRTLDSIAAAIGARGIVLVSLDPRRTAAAIASGGLEEANVDYRNGWWRFDSRIAMAKARGLLQPGFLTVDADFLRREDTRRDPFFQDFAARHGIGEMATYPAVDPVDQGVLTVSAFRDIKHGAYEADALARLRVLAPHVVRAVEFSARLAEAKRQADDVHLSLERMPFGVMLLDGGGRVRYANLIAEGLMPGYLALDAGRLPRALAAGERTGFDRLVASALRGDATGGALVLRGAGTRGPLFVEAIPLQADACRFHLMGERSSAVLITLRDLFGRTSRSVADDLVALDLTRGEARVAMLVGRGQSPREAARRLGVAEATVRVQLRACFAKLGLNRQSELAVLVTRLDDCAGP